MSFNPYEEVNTYFVFHQRVVILNILKIAKAQKKKKTIEGADVYTNYIDMCEKYNIEPVFKNGFLYALKAFEVAGFIKITAGMRITKLDLEPYTVDQWIEAILQDPEFKIIREGEQ